MRRRAQAAAVSDGGAVAKVIWNDPNQLTDSGGNLWSPGESATLPRPEHAEALARCQATTVSGFRMMSALRQLLHARDSHAQSHRSAFAIRNRRGRDRWSTGS